jgi:hypothetical protein
MSDFTPLIFERKVMILCVHFKTGWDRELYVEALKSMIPSYYANGYLTPKSYIHGADSAILEFTNKDELNMFFIELELRSYPI